MKGWPREAVARVARQAVRDVVFLFHLHQQVNRKFLEENRHFWTRAMLLATELDALRREQFLRDQMAWSWFRVGMELPYPLDPETAAAVDAAREHHVLTWEVLEEGDDITGWVQEYFIAQGKAELPYQAYSLRGGSRSSSSSGPSEEEVRALFPEEAEFETFLAGEDYGYGLAGVTDSEFEEKWDAVFQGIKGLVTSGKVQEGVVVELPTVPHAMLRDAPLVEGEWLDRYVVALAEWGARLQARGHELQEPEDSHPMAWYRVVAPENVNEVDATVLKRVWAQTEKHLAGFPGRTRDIQGRGKFAAQHPFTPEQEELLSPVSIQCYIRAIRAFFNWLYREGYTWESRLERLKVPKAPNKLVDPLTEVGIAAILSSIDAQTSWGARNSTIILLMLDAGLRFTELLTLEMKDLHLEAGYVKEMGKGQKERIAPFGSSAQKALMKYIFHFRPEPWREDRVFLNLDGSPLTPAGLKLVLQRMAKSSGVKRLHAHLLRHTFAVNYLMNGGDVFTLQQILGHTTLELVRRYVNLASAHVMTQHKRFSPVDKMNLRQVSRAVSVQRAGRGRPRAKWNGR